MESRIVQLVKVGGGDAVPEQGVEGVAEDADGPDAFPVHDRVHDLEIEECLGFGSFHGDAARVPGVGGKGRRGKEDEALDVARDVARGRISRQPFRPDPRPRPGDLRRSKPRGDRDVEGAARGPSGAGETDFSPPETSGIAAPMGGSSSLQEESEGSSQGPL